MFIQMGLAAMLTLSAAVRQPVQVVVAWDKRMTIIRSNGDTKDFPPTDLLTSRSAVVPVYVGDRVIVKGGASYVWDLTSPKKFYVDMVKEEFTAGVHSTGPITDPGDLVRMGPAAGSHSLLVPTDGSSVRLQNFLMKTRGSAKFASSSMKVSLVSGKRTVPVTYKVVRRGSPSFDAQLQIDYNSVISAAATLYAMPEWKVKPILKMKGFDALFKTPGQKPMVIHLIDDASSPLTSELQWMAANAMVIVGSKDRRKRYADVIRLATLVHRLSIARRSCDSYDLHRLVVNNTNVPTWLSTSFP